MPCIYDLPKNSLKRLKLLATNDSVKNAVEAAMNGMERRSRDGAAALNRLILDDRDRETLLASLKRALATEGFEGDGSDMLPIGHVYEGLIQKLSHKSACAC